MMQPLIFNSEERIRQVEETRKMMARKGLEVPTTPIAKPLEQFVEMWRELDTDTVDPVSGKTPKEYKTVPLDQSAELQAQGWKV